MRKRGFFYLKNTLIFSVLLFLFISIPPVFASQINQTLTYDGNGNLITGDGKYREYNEFNQLLRVYDGSYPNGTILESYLYHPTEDRILIKYNDYASSTPGDAVVYVNKNLEKSYDNLGGTPRTNYTYYTFDENGLVGQATKNSTNATLRILYYHNDYSGSVSLITNSSGNVVEQTFYDPFGAILSGGYASRYYYEGKEFSSVTEDFDFHFRKYDPSLMIFTQPDSVIANVYDPQSLNRYSFEKNNPYKYVDENGQVAVVIAGIAITYTTIELIIDLISTGISIWQFAKDPKSTVNKVALIADIVDLASGPASNPGPSGLMVLGSNSAWKHIENHLLSKVNEQAVSQVFYNIEKTYSPESNYNNVLGTFFYSPFNGLITSQIGIGFYNPLANFQNLLSNSPQLGECSFTCQSSASKPSQSSYIEYSSITSSKDDRISEEYFTQTSSSYGKVYPGGICGITASCA